MMIRHAAKTRPGRRPAVTGRWPARSALPTNGPRIGGRATATDNSRLENVRTTEATRRHYEPIRDNSGVQRQERSLLRDTVPARDSWTLAAGSRSSTMNNPGVYRRRAPPIRPDLPCTCRHSRRDIPALYNSTSTSSVQRCANPCVVHTRHRKQRSQWQRPAVLHDITSALPCISFSTPRSAAAASLEAHQHTQYSRGLRQGRPT